MSYSDLLGILHSPGSEYEDVVNHRIIKLNDSADEYDFVRYGLPRGTLNFEKTKVDREILLKHYYSNGYSTWPSSKINSNVRKHIALFRASLDLWEQFAKDRSFSKDEIYIRSLREGHSFTETIRKMRATCLRAFSSETDTAIDEEYFVSTYKGYNSIIHERYLIHWDDTKDVDDIKYAFFPREKERTSDFRRMVRELFKDFRVEELNFPDSIDMISSLKNNKMYDPASKKTMLMREFWNGDIDVSSPYFAKRVVVPTEPGHTRDTGVGDPSSILKVKQLNMLARVISEHLPYSANCSGKDANARYKRVLKKNAFLHLDFKKFGLTWPRDLTNVLIQEIGRASGLDTDHLIIHDFYVEIDGEVYQTERGTMLGWLDSMNSICCSAILHHMAKDLVFDFVTFNDDVEISKRVNTDLKGTLELLRMAVIAELSSFDILISIDKTYGSRGSVFLERYAYFERNYDLDMYKEQLTVAAYAKSLVTEYPWQAKMFFAAAELWTKSEYATDRCIDTCPVEFRKEEITLPVWAGGWYLPIRNGLDYSLTECDGLAYYLGIELSKYKPKKYSTKREKPSSHEKIWKTTNELAFHSNPAIFGEQIFDPIDTSEINSDVGLIVRSVVTLCDLYSGKKEDFPRKIVHIVEKACGLWEDPPG